MARIPSNVDLALRKSLPWESAISRLPFLSLFSYFIFRSTSFNQKSNKAKAALNQRPFVMGHLDLKRQITGRVIFKTNTERRSLQLLRIHSSSLWCAKQLPYSIRVGLFPSTPFCCLIFHRCKADNLSLAFPSTPARAASLSHTEWSVITAKRCPLDPVESGLAWMTSYIRSI